MKFSRHMLAATAVTAVVLTPAFGGSLVKGTLNQPGDLTIDTNQNLEFLTPSATRGLTYNQILASPFVTQDGFRIATVAQFQQLATDAGVTDFSGRFTTADVAGVNTLISFLGQTIPGPITLPAPGFQAAIAEGFYGFAISPSTLPGFFNVAGADAQSAALGQAPQDQARLIPELIQFGPGQQPPPIVGGFLVRTATPEPASLGAMGLGLATLLGLGIYRRRHMVR